jgi:hypothetical protein
MAPPLAENIDVVDGNINVLFESGSPVYSGILNRSTSYPIDGYMSVNMDKMFAKVLQQKENEEKRRIERGFKVDKYIKDEDELEEEKTEDDDKEK